MLARAESIKATTHSPTTEHITFVKGNITSIPATLIPSETADCVISNCVINLVPREDKPAVFREMYRLLKPGGRGRVAVSDILAKKPLPEALSRDVALYVGCIAGASTVAEYEAWLAEAGFRGELFLLFFFSFSFFFFFLFFLFFLFSSFFFFF
jgi:ubiquinone/menaquinone biosynthesis C-methylase UbiE